MEELAAIKSNVRSAVVKMNKAGRLNEIIIKMQSDKDNFESIRIIEIVN